MPVFPAILCGGAGARLWPASRPGREKPFARLAGPRSGFQETALRAAPLGPLLVVGAASRRALIEDQLREIDVAADLLLEPEPRGTAAAAAAAALWAAARDPEAVVVLLPADHHVADAAAFRAAIAASLPAAHAGRIVTLGVRPTASSTAYGYIVSGQGEGPVRPVAAFVEKPPPDAAAELVARGAFWNSGVFVARADVLAAQLEALAPEVAAAVRAALDASADDRLGAVFGRARAIAFDRAVMEKTALASVLPVDFAWSDLGAWEAVWGATDKDAAGNSLPVGAQAVDAHDLLVRAPEGVKVAVVGASRLAVVVEADAVLVTSLDAAQAVRDVAGGPPPPFRDLDTAAEWALGWFSTAALPLWATLGVDPATGGFREGLTPKGRIHDPRRRARVQARQAVVFARAAVEGLPGPWLATARRGFDWYASHALRPDGLYAHALTPGGAVETDDARLYEHAFVLLALSTLAAAQAGGGDRAQAHALRDRLERFRHPGGGYREAGPAPFQANAQMHLLEAALALGDAALAEELAVLALTRFIDPATGAILEHFDADWRPLATDLPQIEPGHQFEWAFLLHLWGGPGAEAAAGRLYEAGLHGFDPVRGVVVNALHGDLTVRDGAARLWPQTEFLRAAVTFGRDADALAAAGTIRRFLDTPVRGVWRERMAADGAFADEPAPATSLYHLTTGLLALTQRLR